MGQDDLNLTDPMQGKNDLTSQVQRFSKVNDILQRAIARLAAIQEDLAASGGPSSDPSVQAVLQQICASAAGASGLAIPSASGVANPVDGIIVKVIKNPGPPSDPAVQQTLAFVQQIGQSISATGLIAP